MRTLLYLGLLMLFFSCNDAPPPVEQTAIADDLRDEKLAINDRTEVNKVAISEEDEWHTLFGEDLAKADYPEDIWSINNGELTATEDQHIWTKQDYDNFELELEFKNADGTNSGVIVYCSDVSNWIPNSVEIQIADDYNKTWAEADPSWRCGAIFGHQPADHQVVVKNPGEWNTYKISCVDSLITVVLNGRLVNTFNMARYTSATTNPDGSEIPGWLSTPKVNLPTHGKIGLQGKHAGAPVWFRNLRVREL